MDVETAIVAALGGVESVFLPMRGVEGGNMEGSGWFPALDWLL